MRNKFFWLSFLFVIIIILLSGCATTQYILVVQYTNPNIEETEQMKIYVSQHEYDNLDVGDEYSLKVHTAILGIKIPITKYTNTSGVGMIDVAPLFLMAIPIYFLVSTLLFSDKERGKWRYILVAFAIVAFSFLLASTTAPDFDTVAIIIDKTSGLY